MADRKVELPPRDSWISGFTPGEAFHIDADLLQKLNEQTRKYRELRGNILAACFGVEYSLDLAIDEVFFPGLDMPAQNSNDSGVAIHENAKALNLKELFDEFFLKRASLSFKFKIDLLRKLARRISLLQALIPPDLLNHLDEVETYAIGSLTTQ